MKVLVFTEKNDYFNIIRQLVYDENPKLTVERVTEWELGNLTLSSPKHVLVLDDRLYNYLNEDCLEIFKKNYNPILLLLENQSEVKKYLSLNVVDFFVMPMDWKRFKTSLVRCIHNMQRLSLLIKNEKVINKLVLKRKNDILFINFEKILYLEKKDKLVLIHTNHDTYETHDSLKNMMKTLPKSFLRVHSSYIVNFDHAYKIVEIKNKSYYIHFKNYDGVAHMSRQKASDILNNPETHPRLYYIDHERKG